MKLGSGIRIALTAAMLLAQLALPLAHGLGFATEHRSFLSNGPDVVVAATADGPNGSAHDPNLCPTCFALSQARVAIGQVLPALFFAVTGSSAAQPLEPSVVPPRAPDLATAPPRAPPIRSLSFA